MNTEKFNLHSGDSEYLNDPRFQAYEKTINRYEELTDNLVSVAGSWFSSTILPSSRNSHVCESQPRRPRKRSPERVESLLRRRLMRNAIDELHSKMDLERCAILLPSVEKPDFWHFAEHIGVPGEVLADSYYESDEGLTGLVLRGDPVVTGDILNDERRSGKFGDKWISCEGEKIARSNTRAYVGAPIWHQVSDLRRAANGAVICIREKTPFSKAEISYTTLVANLVAYGLDSFSSWRDRAESDIRQLQLSRLWNTPCSDSQKYEDVLNILQQELPFKRLLLSLVNEDNTRIVGSAVVGFRPELLKETDRIIYKMAPSHPEVEDILALTCRENLTAPFVVSPQSTLWSHVHSVTAFRHQVSNPLLIVPMMSSSHRRIGVVLAEMPDGHLALSRAEMDRFALYANQVANLIEAHRQRQYEEKLNQTWGEIHNIVFNPVDVYDFEKFLVSIETTLLSLRKTFDLYQVVVYFYDEANHLLKGMVSSGVDRNAVLNTVIGIRSDIGVAQSGYDIAVRALHADSIVSATSGDGGHGDVSLSPFACSNSCVNAFAIPLKHGDRSVGVMVATKRTSLVQGSERLQALGEFSPAIAHMLSNMVVARTLDDARREVAAHQSLSYGVGQIAAMFTPTSSQVSLHKLADDQGLKIRSILEDVSKIFDAVLVQLFFPPVPLAFKEEQSRVTVNGDTEFRQCGMYVNSGLPENERRRVLIKNDNNASPRKIYVAGAKGLTASVLKTMKSQVSVNIPDDPLWSGMVHELEGDRTWMGVPLTVNHDGIKYFFGALTVTRLRYDKDDSREFGVKEIRTAENIANLLSLALLKRHQYAEVSRRVKSCLSWFRHDVPGLIHDVENEVRLLEREVVEGQWEMAKRRAPEISGLSEAIRSCFGAFGAVYDSQEKDGDLDREKITFSFQMQLEELIRRDRYRGDTEFDVNFEDLVDKDVCIGQGYLLYVCYSLVHNSFRSCCDNKNNTTPENPGKVSLRFGFPEGNFVVSVVDNGVGVSPGVSFNDLVSEGFSGWGEEESSEESGMGLFIVNTLVVRAGGKLEFSPNENGSGVCFCVELPKVQ